VYYSGGKRAETGVTIVVHKGTMRSVVIKIDDSINALKIKAEMVKHFIVQEYMPPLVYEDDEMEELYPTTEEILEQDGKGETNTIVMGE
jgi:tRNA threonylcarbamoyladenosine modification (KEOPS) complex Cgi121 subunit